MADNKLLKYLLAVGDNHLPLCGHYAILLSLADKVTHSREKSRGQYGLYTYREWSNLLQQNGISI